MRVINNFFRVSLVSFKNEEINNSAIIIDHNFQSLHSACSVEVRRHGMSMHKEQVSKCYINCM